jgi:hypothetical protein
MGSIYQLNIADRTFDPDVTAAVCEAFDRACLALRDTGQPDLVQEVIARRVIEIAARGEHDPTRLCEATLASLGLTRLLRTD